MVNIEQLLNKSFPLLGTGSFRVGIAHKKQTTKIFQNLKTSILWFSANKQTKKMEPPNHL